MAAHPRVGAVGGDQHVTSVGGAVGEVGGHGAVGVVLVVRAGLAELDDVLQAGEQHLAHIIRDTERSMAAAFGSSGAQPLIDRISVSMVK